MWPFSSSPPKVYTGRTRTAIDLCAVLGDSGLGPVPTLGKQLYAEADSTAIIWLAQQARAELFTDGITQWRDDATCTLFAAEFVAKANRLFFKQAFQDPISEKLCAFAAGEIWFHPDATPLSGHAIGLCLTERGLVSIDPQLPDTLRPLSAAELASAYAVRFL